MKTRAYIVYLVILVVGISAFSLPMLISNATNQEYHDPDFIIANSGQGSATPTSSSTPAAILKASPTKFWTAIYSPTATISFTPPLLTPTGTATNTPSHTPTTSPSPTGIPPTATNRPRSPDTEPLTTPAPPTNPPPSNPPATDPAPTDPPIIPPIIRTILP